MTSSLPNLGYGLGLRSQHWDAILCDRPKKVQWFEIISENFMNNHGYPREVLAKIREDYPVAMHGVSLSIGSADPLNQEYIAKLKALAEWLEPAWISDHICWTGVNHVNTHDLLPVPYTEDALAQMVSKVTQLQDYLGRQILLENPSNYMEFAANTMPEWEFVTELLKQADCLLLLDINNIYVTCFNHRLDPKIYIDAIPAERIGQIHLAGHEHHGTHIIDTHDDHVTDEVLALYAYAMRTKGMRSTMVEWDSNIPDFPTMLVELERVKGFVETNDLPNFAKEEREVQGVNSAPYDQLMSTFQSCVLERSEPSAEWVIPKSDFPPAAQMGVYQHAYRMRLFNAVKEDYPETRAALGEEEFDLILRSYVEHTPSQFYALEPYMRGFVAFLTQMKPEHAALAQLEAEISALREQPQPKALTPEDFAQVAPEEFLQLNLTLSPATKLLSDQLLHCKQLDVHAYALESIEVETLKAIHETTSLQDAMQLLYERGICTAENVLPTLQQVLVEYVGKGVFVSTK